MEKDDEAIGRGSRSRRGFEDDPATAIGALAIFGVIPKSDVNEAALRVPFPDTSPDPTDRAPARKRTGRLLEDLGVAPEIGVGPRSRLRGDRSSPVPSERVPETPQDATTLNVRGIDRVVAERIKAIGLARGWTIAQTLSQMTRFVSRMQELADGPQRAPHSVGDLLDDYGLSYVRL